MLSVVHRLFYYAHIIRKSSQCWDCLLMFRSHFIFCKINLYVEYTQLLNPLSSQWLEFYWSLQIVLHGIVRHCMVLVGRVCVPPFYWSFPPEWRQLAPVLAPNPLCAAVHRCILEHCIWARCVDQSFSLFHVFYQLTLWTKYNR